MSTNFIIKKLNEFFLKILKGQVKLLGSNFVKLQILKGVRASPEVANVKILEIEVPHVFYSLQQ